ncbi:MAG TPA: hypothetical protein VIM96_11360 [Pseudomonadales bacterium]
MKNPINHPVIREASNTPAHDTHGKLIPQAIHLDLVFHSVHDIDMQARLFPARRDAQGFLPLLPYQALSPSFRQLLLELESSILIRALEKISGIAHLLADPLYEQTILGDIPNIHTAISDALNTPHSAGITPALVCVIALDDCDTGHGMQRGDLWIQPASTDMAPATPASQKKMLFLYYHHHTDIDHGTVKIL